ncbi:MAG: hypothetical protein ABIE94_03425 [archaeon]
MKKAIKRILALGAGATLVGATIMGAMALTLADYPKPFVTDGMYDATIVVGERAATSDVLGAIDIAASLQAEARTATAVEVESGTVVVTDGDTEEVALGSAAYGGTGLDATYTDDDLSVLQDTSIDVNGTDIDIHDEINLAGTLDVTTSLTTLGDDDYGSNVALAIANDALKYCYVFDEAVNLGNNVNSDNTLEIEFMGTTLELTSIVAENSLRAIAGTKVFLNAGESVEVESKTVTFVMAGSSSAVVEVDGSSKVINTGQTSTVGGLKVKVESLFNEDGIDYDAATLIIGSDAEKTYDDGDGFIGQDEDDPDWKWDLGALTYGTTPNSNQTLCVENDFIYDNWKDGPTPVGEYYSFPNNFVEVGIDSLTVSDSNYMPMIIEFETGLDITDVYAGETNEAVITISVTGEDEGLQVTTDGGTTWVGTDTIYLWLNGTTNWVDVLYIDSDNDVAAAQTLNMNSTENDTNIARINYKDTKSTDMPLDLIGDAGVPDGLRLEFDTGVTGLNGGTDDILLNLSHSTTAFDGFGITPEQEEALELTYGGSGIGTKDEDHRTMYGIIIYDPESGLSNDELNLDIPGDQVKANVVVRTTASSVSGGAAGTSYQVNPIAVGMAALDKDVTLGSGPMIIVGGPNANTIAMEIMGNPVDPLAFFEEGKAMITFYSAYNSILVAGYEADETLGACYVLADYEDYTLTGTEVEVIVADLNDITVNPVSS